MPALQSNDLVVTFGSLRALDGLTLTAESGQVTALLGPNGAGKTTFIRCCTGLARPASGTLTILGGEPGSAAVLPKIGLMPQSTGAWSGVRAGELLRYLARLYADPQPVDDLIALLGIGAFEATPYRRLSGGQQQAVNLAGALVGRPALVFLDEPTAGLDPRARRLTWDVVRSLRDSDVAVLLTTHDMAEAAELADRVHIIDHGAVRASGTAEELAVDGSLEDAYLRYTSGEPR